MWLSFELSATTAERVAETEKAVDEVNEGEKGRKGRKKGKDCEPMACRALVR